MPKTLPISDLRFRQAALLDNLAEEPILLTRQGKAVAVLVDPGQWNRLLEQLEDLQDVTTILRKEQAIAAGTLEETDVDIAELEAWQNGVSA